MRYVLIDILRSEKQQENQFLFKGNHYFEVRFDNEVKVFEKNENPQEFKEARVFASGLWEYNADVEIRNFYAVNIE